jgi:basic membrane lipoprotein Med (substrate-binding protein (PBP1-ABC) superfamily)
VKHTETSIGTFNDPSVAKEAANAKIASGADVLYAFLDAAYIGVLEAADASGDEVKVVLAERSSSVCGRSHAIVGATTLDGPVLFRRIARAYRAGRLPRRPVVVGVESGVLGFALCDEYRTPALRATAKRAQDALESGKVRLKESGGG